jgi:hypothetical protein
MMMEAARTSETSVDNYLHDRTSQKTNLYLNFYEVTENNIAINHEKPYMMDE